MTTVEVASSAAASQQQPLMARDRPELARGTEVGGLRVEALVDSGGQGTVYRARDLDSGRHYALKFIPLGRAEGWAKREFALCLHLHHPNLVHLVGSGLWPAVSPEFLWLKMAYVQGRPLDRWAWEENADARALTGKVLGVARGLAVAHDAGVVHRDVKEANILVREGDGEAVLVDFGAAWSQGQPTLTQGLYPPGTPHYRSPEAWRFGLEHAREAGAHYRPGVADDLYALGVALYRVLTRRYPFEVGDKASIKTVIRKAPLPPHFFNPRVPRALSEVCLKLLAKKPEERPESAAALCQELEALLERVDAAWQVPLQEAHRAGGPGLARMGLTRRRLRRVAAGVGVLVALGLGGRWLAEPMREAASGREVAPSWRPQEAGRAAAPPQVEDTPAAVASRAMPLKDMAPMKKQKRSKAPADSTPRGNSSSLAKWCVGAAMSTACAGAQVQPVPEPLPLECPPGAVEAMTGPLGLSINSDWNIAVFGDPDTDARWLTLREGATTLSLRETGKVPMDTTLYGHLSFGKDRVYGRFTQAQTPTGETYPVCIELWNNGKRGTNLKAREGPHTARVFSVTHVKVVERFE